jgi:hypothetical protein
LYTGWKLKAGDFAPFGRAPVDAGAAAALVSSGGAGGSIAIEVSVVLTRAATRIRRLFFLSVDTERRTETSRAGSGARDL